MGRRIIGEVIGIRHARSIAPYEGKRPCRDRTERHDLALTCHARIKRIVRIDDRNGDRLILADVRIAILCRCGERILVSVTDAREGDRAGHRRIAVIDFGADRRHRDELRLDLKGVGRLRDGVVRVIHVGNGDGVIAHRHCRIDAVVGGAVRADGDIVRRETGARNGDLHIVACFNARNIHSYAVIRVAVGIDTAVTRSVAARHGQSLGRDLHGRGHVGDDVVAIRALDSHAVGADVHRRSHVSTRRDAEGQLITLIGTCESGSVVETVAYALTRPGGHHRTRRAVIARREGRSGARRIRRAPSQRDGLRADHDALLCRSGESVVCSQAVLTVIKRIEGQGIGTRVLRGLDHAALRIVTREIGLIRHAAVGVLEGQIFGADEACDLYGEDIVSSRIIGEARHRSHGHGDRLCGDDTERVSIRGSASAVHAVHAVVTVGDRDGHALARADVLIRIGRTLMQIIARENAREGDRAGHIGIAVIDLGADRRHRDTLGDDREGLGARRDRVVAAIVTAEIVCRDGDRVAIDVRRRVVRITACRIRQGDIGAAQIGMSGIYRHLVARIDARDREPHAVRRLAVDEGGLVGEGRDNRRPVDGQGSRRVGHGIVAVRARNGHAVGARIDAGISTIRHVEGQGIAVVYARIGAARHHAGVGRRRSHRPGLLIIGSGKGRRSAACDVRTRRGIIRCAPSQGNALCADREGGRETAIRQGVVRAVAAILDGRDRHCIIARARIDRSVARAVRRAGSNGDRAVSVRRGLGDVHGDLIAVDHVAHGEGHALRALIIGIARAVIRPSDVQRLRADRRRRRAGEDRAVCRQRVIGIREGVVDSLVLACACRSKGNGHTEIIAREELVFVAADRRRGRLIVSLIRNGNARDHDRIDREGGGQGLTRRRYELVVLAVRTGDLVCSHEVRGDRAARSRDVDSGKVITVLRHTESGAVAHRHGGIGGKDAAYSDRHAVRRLIVGINAGATRGIAPSHGDAPQGDRHGRRDRLDPVVITERLRCNRYGVRVHRGRGVIRRSSKRRRTVRRIVDHGDRNAVLVINARNSRRHAVQSAVVGTGVISRRRGPDEVARRSIVCGEGDGDERALDDPIQRAAFRDRIVIASSAVEIGGSGVIARAGSAAIHTADQNRVAGIHLVRRLGTDRAVISVEVRRNGLDRLVVGECGYVIPSQPDRLRRDLPRGRGQAATRELIVHSRRGSNAYRRGIGANVLRAAAGQATRSCREGVLREHAVARDHVGEGDARAVLRRSVIGEVIHRPRGQSQGHLIDRIGSRTRRDGVVAVRRVACRDIRGVAARILLLVARDQRSIRGAVHADHSRADRLTVHRSHGAVRRARTGRRRQSPDLRVIGGREVRGVGGIAVRAVLHRPGQSNRLRVYGEVVRQAQSADIVVIRAAEATQGEGEIHRAVRGDKDLVRVGVVHARGIARRALGSISAARRIRENALLEAAARQGVSDAVSRDHTAKADDVALPDVRAGIDVCSGSRVIRRAVVVRPGEVCRRRLGCGIHEVRLDVVEGDCLLIDRPSRRSACKGVVRRATCGRTATGVCERCGDRDGVATRIDTREGVRGRAVAEREVAYARRRRRTGAGRREVDGLAAHDALDRHRPALRRSRVSEDVGLGPGQGQCLGCDGPGRARRSGELIVIIGESLHRRRIGGRIGLRRRGVGIGDRADVALYEPGQSRRGGSVRRAVVGRGRIGPDQADRLLRDRPRFAREGTAQGVIVAVSTAETTDAQGVGIRSGDIDRICDFITISSDHVGKADVVARDETSVLVLVERFLRCRLDARRGHRAALIVDIGARAVAADCGVIPATDVECALRDRVGVAETRDGA